jgi:hypothetical protein
MSDDTMIGRWDHWHTSPEPTPMGLSDAYQLGADFLQPCGTVEDWGCGGRYLSECLRPHQRYIGVDGSGHPDRRVDLRAYRSEVDGVFMRAVLEHNYDWWDILQGFLRSFTKRAVLVLFTPWCTKRDHVWEELGYDDDPGCPILSFGPGAILGPCAQVSRSMGVRVIDSPNTAYGSETIITLVR